MIRILLAILLLGGIMIYLLIKQDNDDVDYLG